MSTEKRHLIHFEGTFNGVYRIGTSIANLGIHDFRRMEWEFMEISITRRLDDRDVDAEKVLDFQYLPILFSSHRRGLFRSPSAEIIVRDDRFGKFSPDLHDVVLTGHTGGRTEQGNPIRYATGNQVSYDLRECKGTIRFSVPNPEPPKAPESAVVPEKTLPTSTTVKGAASPVLVDKPTETYAGKGGIPLSDPISNTTGGRAGNLPTTPGTWGQRMGGCLSTLLMLGLVFYLLSNFPIPGVIGLALLLAWLMRGSGAGNAPGFSPWTLVLLIFACILLFNLFGTNPFAFLVLLLISLVYLFTRGSRSGFWRTVTSLVMLLALLALGGIMFGNLWDYLPQTGGDGRSSVRLEDVKPIPDSDKPDSMYVHAVDWQDFINNRFQGEYITTYRQYQQSGQFHRALAEMEAPNDANRYWHSIYQLLSRNDSRKMDSLVNFMRNRSDSLKLDPSQTAEMVVTFIQKIPYYLIHDGTCQAAIQSGGFMADYHREGKPCLPEVVAGVQSPYEFIHDLRGDCDTRSLLAHTLLSALNIPSSVWVSEAYGHSVVGIGLPAGGSNYKMVSGVRHFAVELTAEGFRLGMIAPDQTDMDNWSVVLHKNF